MNRRALAELHARAARRFQDGRLEEAEALYRRILQAGPGAGDAASQADVLHLLGVIAFRLGRPEEAAERLERAVARRPDDAGLHNTLGVVLQALGRREERIAAYRRAVRLAPEDARAWSNLGAALNDSGDAIEAEAACRRALALAPDDVDTLVNLGAARRGQGRFGAAARCLRRALALAPGHAEALNNLGTLLQAEDRRAEAEACFARAVAAAPGLAPARFNLGLLHLARGELAAGWAGYDHRAEAVPPGPPSWQGENLRGRRIRVRREQGLGDELMFASCYPDLIARAGHVVIGCDPRLVGLFARSFPRATVRPDDDAMADVPVDVQVRAGSLPRRLRPTLADFPAPLFPDPGGYLQADPERVAAWRRRLAALGPGPKVGICWRSGLTGALRAGAYTGLESWGPVLAVPGVRFVSLQYGTAEGEIRRAERRFGVPVARWDDLDLKDDLENVAALTAALDLVITAATAAGELAGALGVPVWRFAGAGDWTGLGAPCRPWFPTLRRFHARPGEGLDTALERIGRALAAATAPESR